MDTEERARLERTVVELSRHEREREYLVAGLNRRFLQAATAHDSRLMIVLEKELGEKESNSLRGSIADIKKQLGTFDELADLKDWRDQSQRYVDNLQQRLAAWEAIGHSYWSLYKDMQHKIHRAILDIERYTALIAALEDERS